MPSHLGQQGIIITGRRRGDGTPFYILIARKTGFMDVWINGKHFYYNYSGNFDSLDDVDIEKIIEEVQNQQRKKKTIVIRRK